jgi:hypothetical protein
MTAILAVALTSFLGFLFCSFCEASLYGVTPTQVEVLRRRKVPGTEISAKSRHSTHATLEKVAASNSFAQSVGEN